MSTAPLPAGMSALELLQNALDGTASLRTRIVWLVGRTGTGKTKLLQDLARSRPECEYINVNRELAGALIDRPAASRPFDAPGRLSAVLPARPSGAWLADNTELPLSRELQLGRKRMLTAAAPQMELFISDQRSAIERLTDFLRRKPSTYQEVHPEFIKQLGAGWKKHEAKPELSALREDNFLRYDPRAKDAQNVPSQIHSHLSSNWATLRNLDKNDPRLKAAATDRWFVPDPTKAQELENVREKAPLKEFEIYKAPTGRKLKEFRLEVMRTGFKVSWGNRDDATIIAVARRCPTRYCKRMRSCGSGMTRP